MVLCKHPGNLKALDQSVNANKDIVMEMLQNITDRIGKLEMAASGANLTGGGAEMQHSTTEVDQHAKEKVFTDLVQHASQPQLSEIKPGSDSNGHKQLKSACTTISINRVGSYYLSGYVSNCPVDTGAGVSLMCRTIWDKVKPADGKLD